MNKIINMTPHPVMVVNAEGELLVTLPAYLAAPRVVINSLNKAVETFVTEGGDIFSVEVEDVSVGEVQGLPEQQEGVVLVVSSMVLDNSNRSDLIAPGQLARNEQGQIFGLLTLKRIAR